MTREHSKTNPTDSKRAIFAVYLDDYREPADRLDPFFMMKLAEPLDVLLHRPLLHALMIELRRYPLTELSPGLVNRIARQLRRQFSD